MVIEALINGEVLTRCEIPEEYLQDLEGMGWRRNVEFREQVVGMYLDGFRKKMEKFFQPGFQIDYVLVFPSKANTYEEKDDPIGGRTADPQPHHPAKNGDPCAAARPCSEGSSGEA